MEKTVKLGNTGPEVFELGLGCMGMSGAYGPSDEDESIRTIQAAIERGVTLIDTGDFYGMGHNELLIGKAIAGRRDKIKLSVKFGALRSPDGRFVGIDTRPAAIKNFISYSLVRLGVEVIDIYRPARLDPSVPIEETVGAISELIQAGYVRHIGLSEVGADTIRRANAVHPIVDLQIEYSLASRRPELNIFPTLHELGISATLYGVLSRGLFSGSRPSAPGDWRRYSPRFSAEHQDKNDRAVRRLAEFAKAHDMTPGQLAIAWVRTKQPQLLPIIGARTVAQLDDMLGVAGKRLTDSDIAELDRIVPAEAFGGERYAPEQMAHLDSER